MPGVVSRTSTYALTNLTLPYAARLAGLGFTDAVEQDPALAKGVNVFRGYVTQQQVAEAVGRPYTPLSGLLG
jgi:alanine dehydrogenase